MMKIGEKIPTRRSFIVFGIFLCITAGFVLGLFCGYHMSARTRHLTQLEYNLNQIKPGMTSGEAAKIIAENVVVYRQDDVDRTHVIWAISANTNAYFLKIDKDTDKIVEVKKGSSPRFD